MALQLAGRTILITGAASGIGAASARRLARSGASLVLTDLNTEKLANLAAELDSQKTTLSSTGIKATYVKEKLDVTDEQAVDGVYAKYKVDGVFNCAGINPPSNLLHETDTAFVRQLFEVNYMGIFFSSRAFVKQALSRPQATPSGGYTLVNAASAHGLIGAAGCTAYSSTKHAILGLTRSISKETASKGIRANAICPGPIQTPLLQTLMDEVVPEEAIIAQIPAGRLGTAEEVAQVVNFLMSPESSYVMGTSGAVDGGWIGL